MPSGRRGGEASWPLLHLVSVSLNHRRGELKKEKEKEEGSMEVGEGGGGVLARFIGENYLKFILGLFAYIYIHHCLHIYIYNIYRYIYFW